MNAEIQRCMPCGSQARQQRTGLTSLEFLGCIIAVLGGAWIGALYLGVDLQQVAHTALDEANMLESMPADWRPQSKDKALSRQQLVNTLREELSSLRNEITALRVAELEGVDPSELANPDAAAKQKTLAYWQRLNEVALSELALQQETETAFSATNAAKVFAIKARTSHFTAKAVAAVPTELVDPSVVQFGEQLKNWYERSGELYDHAVEIWDRPTTDPARESMNKEWRARDLQHRNEARLLHERAARVRSAMSRQFREEFPEFAKQAEAEAPAEAATSESAAATSGSDGPTGIEGAPADENVPAEAAPAGIETRSTAS